MCRYAPIVDPCGQAGGKLSSQKIGGDSIFTSNEFAKMGDMGSSLPETAAQKKTQWVAGTSVVVAWGEPAETAFRSLCGFSCQRTYCMPFAVCQLSFNACCSWCQFSLHVAHSAAAVGSLYNHGGGCKFRTVTPWH